MTYMAMELWALAKQWKQHLGKSVCAWLFQLWDEDTGNMQLSPSEVLQHASTTAVPSLQHVLQGTRCTDAHADNQILINWLMAAAKEVWDTPGEGHAVTHNKVQHVTGAHVCAQ